METQAAKPRRNWWKYAFLAMLIIFEFTRELLVLSAAARPVPNGDMMLNHGDGWVSARGRWLRTDGGGALVPVVVAIECRRQVGECLEATTTINDEFVHIPDVNWFEARFTPEAVTYQNDQPECARYLVRIDFRLRQVISVRERKTSPSNPDCRTLEPRLEMQLGNAYQPEPRPLEGHFVPIMSLIAAFS